MDNSRQSYEDGGWADGRLGQAYDLLDEVASGLPEEQRNDLRRIRDMIEAFDCELEG